MEPAEKKSTINGLSIVVAFLVVGIMLYFNNSYFGNQIVTIVISVVCLLFALMGFTVEISRILPKDSQFTSNIIVGIILISIWAVQYHFAPFWWLNIIGLAALLLGLAGFFTGLADMVSYISIKRKGSSVMGYFIVFGELVAAVSAIAAFLKSIGVDLPFDFG
ncbi:hypothetical protein SAMN04488137_4521 [Fictibacillus solisalsi]|uniref:Uncharacterized protein n=1 Tax=Fictibacillus solisalsi TaxID=459525 RepID=A0A1H0BJP9_9BACL|nr:hypothetical protein [Fictibacillus solisalsi]SDN45870.1 hypothetical protein SAMN04488137_4521 [Fictibacillus solisalsi]